MPITNSDNQFVVPFLGRTHFNAPIFQVKSFVQKAAIQRLHCLSGDYVITLSCLASLILGGRGKQKHFVALNSFSSKVLKEVTFICLISVTYPNLQQFSMGAT